MKYFEIQDTPELKYAPRLKNWYGKIDVRDIRLDAFPQLPEMQLFLIEPSERVDYTDIILFPFLLVSPMVREVIEMYRERCFFRRVILLNQQKKESGSYCLPVLDETSNIRLRRISYKNGVYITDGTTEKGERVYPDRNLFWVRDSQKRHIILSMELAESLIRRGVTGLGLCEVELYEREAEEGRS